MEYELIKNIQRLSKRVTELEKQVSDLKNQLKEKSKEINNLNGLVSPKFITYTPLNSPGYTDDSSPK